MFSFSASGMTVPPMIIYPYKRLPQSVASSVPDGWGIGMSDNGWMKSELFYEYITNIFHPFLQNQKIELPVILFVDGHRTHLTYQTSEVCTQLGIILIALYPNATRLLQPADVSAFKPIKENWKKTVLEWRREFPSLTFTKEKFAPLLQRVIANINKKNIINGFRTTGLYPWNPEAIDFTKCLGKSCNNKTMQLKYNNSLSRDDFSVITHSSNSYQMYKKCCCK